MDADEKYGRIKCVSNGAEGTEIIGYQPFEFISADSIDMDEVKIHLTANYAMDDCWGSGYWANMLLKSTLNVNMVQSADATNPTVQQNVQASIGATCKDGASVGIYKTKLIIYQAVEKPEYIITSEPKIPADLNLVAFIINCPKNVINITYKWKMKVKWIDPFKQPWEYEFKREMPKLSVSDTWQLDWKDDKNNIVFVGGDEITVECSVWINNEEYVAEPIVNEFKIVGQNPSRDDAYAGFDDNEKKVMKHESGCKQFWETGFTKINVNSSPPSADYGIMQVNSSNKVTRDEVWNWKKNKTHGKLLLDDAKAYATAWPAAIRANKFNKKHNVDVSKPIFRTCPDFTTDEQLWKETYARYNGCSYKTHYWMWVPPDDDNPDVVSGWVRKTNNNNAADYADIVWNVTP